MKTIRTGAAFLGALLTLTSANAATIYDNSKNDLTTRFFATTTEFGDEINFGGLATDRYLQTFSFEYFGNSAVPGVFEGAVQARVRFYENNGPTTGASYGFAAPGTSLYDSGWFNISPTYNTDPALNGRATLIFNAGSDGIPALGPSALLLPSKLTWSVQFQGMVGGDRVGLDVYSPPTIGSSQDDYWEKIGGTWTRMGNSAGPINFAATFAAVPEPTVLSLLAGAGIALVAFRRK